MTEFAHMRLLLVHAPGEGRELVEAARHGRIRRRRDHP